MTHPHGTRSRYGAGCSCDACRAANAQYMAEWRANRDPNMPIEDYARLEEARLRRAQYRPGYQITERTAAVYGIDISPIPAGLDLEWRTDRACHDQPVDLFFPERGEMRKIAEAKLVCARCPVTNDCLEFGIATKSIGIWGGLTTDERHKLTKAGRK